MYKEIIPSYYLACHYMASEYPLHILVGLDKFLYIISIDILVHVFTGSVDLICCPATCPPWLVVNSVHVILTSLKPRVQTLQGTARSMKL